MQVSMNFDHFSFPYRDIETFNTNFVITSFKEVIFSPMSVCLQNYSKTTDQIFMKFYVTVGHNSGHRLGLDFE